MKVAFAVTDTTPRDVLNRIAQLRNGKHSPVAQTPAATSIATAKSETLALLAEARTALSQGDLKRAEALAGQASRLNVADSQFTPQQDSPAKLAAALQRARGEAETIDLAASTLAQDLRLPKFGENSTAVPHMAAVPESAPLPLPTLATDEPTNEPLSAQSLIEEGEQALLAGKRAKALELFRAASQFADQLDPASQNQLQSHLRMLSGQPEAHTARVRGDSLIDLANSGHKVLARQLSAEVGRRQSEAAKNSCHRT